MEWNSVSAARLLPSRRRDQVPSGAYRSGAFRPYLALIFEKPSLRTRVTFEVGVASLGGIAVFLDHTLTHLGERETVHDIAKNLERWVHGIVARVFAQESLEEFARNANIPVINALSDKISSLPGPCRFLHVEERFGICAASNSPISAMAITCAIRCYRSGRASGRTFAWPRRRDTTRRRDRR